ncbi:MAG: polysaccharide deacetylase family protein [Clostridiales bacterium]|nr:polysaccharide deacetylase family protein [Clostridiales bacterium]MDY4654789.1 polysaccharide deacetylase family protein [Eubacteriales bacterium]
MRKNNIFLHVVTNVIIVAVLVGLYFACVPDTAAADVSAPIYKNSAAENKVAIMFNVYQGTEYVEQILDTLDKYGVKATFFLGGCWAEKNVDTVKKIYEKNELGNHGYLHLDHAKISKNQNREEIALCSRLIGKITGKEPTLFAPPSGSIGQNMLDVCDELGVKVIMWSKDTIDWRDKDYEVITKRATKDIQSGDMVLMHPTEQTVKALPHILDYYKEKGLEAVTVSELVANMNTI